MDKTQTQEHFDTEEVLSMSEEEIIASVEHLKYSQCAKTFEQMRNNETDISLPIKHMLCLFHHLSPTLRTCIPKEILEEDETSDATLMDCLMCIEKNEKALKSAEHILDSYLKE